MGSSSAAGWEKSGRSHLARTALNPVPTELKQSL